MSTIVSTGTGQSGVWVRYATSNGNTSFPNERIQIIDVSQIVDVKLNDDRSVTIEYKSGVESDFSFEEYSDAESFFGDISCEICK
jgi:uncharacterized protein (DUF1015 family)